MRCSARTCSKFPATTQACTTTGTCAKNDIGASSINGANLPLTADNSEVGSTAQNYYAGFVWSTCQGRKSGESCQPTCTPSVTVTTAYGSSFVLACDAAGYIGYRNTDAAKATAFDSGEGTNTAAHSTYMGAAAHHTAFGYWINFADYPYTQTSDGGINGAGASQANALQCALNPCTASSGGLNNNLVTNAGANVAYTDCETGGKTTGDVCTPTCQDSTGYTATYANIPPQGTASANPINLACSTTGAFDGSTNVQCAPHACTASAVYCGTPGTACSNNRDFTSCDPLASGQTCTPTCKTGFTGDGVATGFKLSCATSTGAFDGNLETGLTTCTANECQAVLASTKRTGINYDECEFMGGSNPYFRTGRGCAVHCDQDMGYTTNLPPDVEVTVSNAGTNYHVDDLLSVPTTTFSTNDNLGAPRVLLKVTGISGALTEADGRGKGPIVSAMVLTPAHFYRGVQSSGTDSAETLTIGTNPQPITSAAVTAVLVQSHVGATPPSGAQFTTKLRRLIIVTAGTGYAAGNTFKLTDAQLGGGGAIDLVFTVASISGSAVATVYIDDALQTAAAPLRKAGLYSNLTPTNVAGTGSGLVVSFIVAPSMELACTSPPGAPTKSNTFDFASTVSSSMTCVANVCNKPPLDTASQTLDWSDCVTKSAGQTCQPVCRGGHATTGNGEALKLVCPNGWIDVSAWASKRTCVVGTCNTAVMTNKLTNVDYSSCNGLNTGQTCTPTCIGGATATGSGSAITLSCSTSGVFSGAQTSPTVCNVHQCTALAPTDATAAQTLGVNYASCVNKYSGTRCYPSCKAGFGNPTGTTSWLLACGSSSGTVNDGTWIGASGTLSCTANTCTGSATTASKKVGVDYTGCNSLSSGGVCNYACDTYSTARSGSPTSFILSCSAGKTFVDPASTSPCVPYQCTGGGVGAGFTGVPNADFTACNALSSGSPCTPTCKTGYRLASTRPGGQPAFPMQCTSALTYANPYAGYPICQAYLCSGTVSGNSKLDYTSCKTSLTGFQCFPTCKDGYLCSATPSQFLLACSSTGAFTDSVNSAITSTANRCMAVYPGTAIVNVDYSHCTVTSSYSGSTCTPRCVAGYSTITAATPFVQACTASTGYFPGTNTIACAVLPGQTCAALGWTTIVNGVCGSTDAKLGPSKSTLFYRQKSYTEAVSICSAAGARLCTQAEIDQGSAKDTGTLSTQASLGNSMVWTSTTCNGGTQHVASHNQATGSYTCSNNLQLRPVQCCTSQYATAPAPPTQLVVPTPTPPPTPGPTPGPTPAPSAKTCAQLGWPKVIENVCAESDNANQALGCTTTVVANAASVCTNAGARLCTASEMNTGVSTGTGCNFDLSYVWTSDTCTLRARSSRRTTGYVTSKGDGTGFTECLTATTNRPVRCCADEPNSVSSRKTCSTLGWSRIVNGVCGESDNSLGGCNAGKTHSQASTICTAAGARLCSVVEVDSGATATTGCDFDTKWVWTSDPCGTNLYWTARGSGSGERKCKPATKAKNVRCCSDIDMATTKAPAAAVLPPPPPPRKSCSTLASTASGTAGGWTRIVGNVCGESDGNGFKKCFNFRTHASAAEICSGMGARLCTSAEIYSTVAKATGCSMDTKYVWTSTVCSGGFIKALGNGNGGLASCGVATEQAPVRCCSDTVVSRIAGEPSWTTTHFGKRGKVIHS